MNIVSLSLLFPNLELVLLLSAFAIKIWIEKKRKNLP
jgi:hypothetical protein